MPASLELELPRTHAKDAIARMTDGSGKAAFFGLGIPDEFLF